MMIRAKETIYWLGFTKDISRVRENYLVCQKFAPSQSNIPPVDPIVTEYPFPHICFDHFTLKNRTYGLVMDRFTNWPGAYIGDSSEDMCRTLTRLLQDYGVPEAVTTDGAINYTSDKVKAFMKQQGIKQRVKSCHCLAAQREAALADRGAKLKERLKQNVRFLPPLQVGDCVIVQNQTGNSPL